MTQGIFHKAVVTAMPLFPRPLIWQFSQRYIAGTTLDDAFAKVRELNDAGCSGTIDVLGEDSTKEAEVQSAIDLYLRALEEIHEKQIDCGISIKLSEMGLRYDEQRCRQAMEKVVSAASKLDQFVRIDMEDSSVTDVTLDIYTTLRERYPHVGAVIQSCLRRSEDDVARLMQEGPTDLRLCKGIYIEPEEIAYRDPDEIRASFNRLLEQILEDSNARVGIATHDPALVDYATAAVERLQVGRERYEFQMLLGVAGPLRRKLVSQGHPLRVYVPFGEHWYAYSMRRLRENPYIAGHIIGNLFRRR
jgi:proline dehydrogenase